MACPYCLDKKYYNANGWHRHMKEKHNHNKVPWYSGEIHALPSSATEPPLLHPPLCKALFHLLVLSQSQRFQRTPYHIQRHYKMTMMHSWMRSPLILPNLNLRPLLLRKLNINWSNCLMTPETMSILFIRLTTLPLPLLFLISEDLMPLTMHNMSPRQLQFQLSQNTLNLIHQKVQCSVKATK